MSSGFAQCAQCAQCFNYARGSGRVISTLGSTKIIILRQSVRLEHCAHCAHCARDGAGQQHQHGGFWHRLAHCDVPQGQGYELIRADTVPPWVVPHALAVAPDRELRR